MGYSTRITWLPLASVDSASLNGTYQKIGNPLSQSGYIVKMVNNGPSVVTVSIDGSTDIDVCPGNSFWLYDEGKVGSTSAFPAIPAGTQFYVKGAASGTVVGVSLIYLVVQYIIVL